MFYYIGLRCTLLKMCKNTAFGVNCKCFIRLGPGLVVISKRLTLDNPVFLANDGLLYWCYLISIADGS